jgi:hypothetical protein
MGGIERGSRTGQCKYPPARAPDLFKIDHFQIGATSVLARISGISPPQTRNFGQLVPLIIMTDQSEPTTNRRSNKIDDTFYTSWIVSGCVAIAIIVAVFAFISAGDDPDLSLPRGIIGAPL